MILSPDSLVYKALLCEVRKVEGAAGSLQHVRYNELHSQQSTHTAPESATDRRRIYLDHNATTPMDPEVLETVARINEKRFGNPSSIHSAGNEARFIVESARRNVAQLLNCTARRIVFTGGGSEANNLAIKGVAYANRMRGNHIITSSIEHPAVLMPCDWLESQGFQVTRLSVNEEGLVSPSDLASAFSPETILVSIMAANNETGALQPIAELGRISREHGALFHTDAVQAVGKEPIDVEQLDIDLLTLSAHKLHGPKGIGALYVRKGVRLDPLVHGGKQEQGLRAGTENVSGIGGLGKAAELAIQRLPVMERIRMLRDRLEYLIRIIVPGAILNGPKIARLANTLNMTLPGIRGESVVMAMDQLGVAISSGSACRAGEPEPSHSLLAMGLTTGMAHCSLRFSLGWNNTQQEINLTAELLAKILNDTATGVRFVPCR